MKAPKLTGNRCRCGACGDYFNSTSTFDRHRTGKFAPLGVWPHSRRCLTPSEMEAKGWQRNSAGFWIERARQAATARVEQPSRGGEASGVAGVGA